jgi:fumarate reductase subunit C
MQSLNRPFIEKRRKPDALIRLVTVISTIGWFMVMICSAITIYAKPEQTNMFYQMFNVPLRSRWNYSLLDIVFILLIFLFILSIFGIIMNAMRQRRKTDKMNKSLIFQAVMSLVGMIILIVNAII